MSDTGDFELFSAPAAQEKDEKSDEKFREEMKRAQQQIAQFQQEEGKVRGHDQKLAAILFRFLSQPQFTDLFLLVSRAVAQNLPSEFIIAILSLVDPLAQKETAGFLAAAKGEKTALAIRRKADFESISPQQKAAIDAWIAQMGQVALKTPQRVLSAAVISGPERMLNPSLIQLAAFILRNFLSGSHPDFDFAALHDFMQGVFVEIVRQLEQYLQGQKRLAGKDIL